MATHSNFIKAQVRTTERIAEFIPGESPPDVNTAIFLIFWVILKIEISKLGNLFQ